MDEVLVGHLRVGPRPLGILVIPRSQEAYGRDDIEMADVLRTFIGRVVASAAPGPLESTRLAGMAESVTDLESDGELAESHRGN